MQRRELFVWASFFCGVFLSSSWFVASADSLRPNQIAAISLAARQAISQNHIPSVVVEVDRGGKRVFEGAWGQRNLAEQIPANTRTLYQYGSITKQITAMGIFLLAQDGKLSLDDPIGKYLPAFAQKAISIRQVLIHTSGLADFTNLPDYPLKIAPQLATGPEWGLNWAASHLLDFPPGTKAQYSNTGYVVLARIIEKASGQPFDDFLQSRIFALANMRTAYLFQFFPTRQNEAVGYLWWGKEIAAYMAATPAQGAQVNHVVNAPFWNLRQADGAGLLVGDAKALQNWDDALLAGKLLRGKWRALYFSSGVLNDGSPAYAGPENAMKVRPSYCYGGFGKMVIDGHTLYGANGGTFGFTTFTAIVPDLHIAVTTLTNLGEVDNRKLTTPVLDALLER